MPLIPAKVLDLNYVAKDIYSIDVEPHYKIDHVKPFNFFMVWIPRVDEIPLSVAYKERDTITFLFKVKGEGTQRLSKVHPGDFIGLKGPLGTGFVIDDNFKHVLVIAGGIGIAPIPFFISKSKYKRLDIVWGVKSSDELFDIDKLFPGINKKYNLIITTEDCSYGVCGTVLNALKNANMDSYDIVLAVGPTAMLNEVCNRFKDAQVYVALETIVKCGLGICGSCYIRSSTKLLCVEGPVFKCNEVKNHLRESVDS